MAKTLVATKLWQLAGFFFRKLSYLFYALSTLFSCLDTYTQDGSIRSPRELWRFYKTCLKMNEVSRKFL